MTTGREDLKSRFMAFVQGHRAMFVSGVVTVVVLAGVILGVAAFGPWSGDGAKKPNPIVVGETKSKLLYQQALEASRSGETTKAAELAKKALAEDPNNADAKQLVEELQASASKGGSGSQSGSNESNGSSDSGGGSGSKKPASDAAFMKKAEKLSLFLPKKFSGYSLGEPVGRDGEISIAATPSSSGAVAARVLWAVHDRQTRAGAKQFLTSTSKAVYGRDEASLTIDGASGYFGTDGTRFATAVYTRGRYVFEVLVTGEGGSPKNLKTLAEKAAGAFSDDPPK